MQNLLISYTVSDPQTYDLVYCFLEVPFSIPDDTDVYEYLKALYPMFSVYIENY